VNDIKHYKISFTFPQHNICWRKKILSEKHLIIYGFKNQIILCFIDFKIYSITTMITSKQMKIINVNPIR